MNSNHFLNQGTTSNLIKSKAIIQRADLNQPIKYSRKEPACKSSDNNEFIRQ